MFEKKIVELRPLHKKLFIYGDSKSFHDLELISISYSSTPDLAKSSLFFHRPFSILSSLINYYFQFECKQRG